ncbi:MAG: hypothetical protein HOP02_16945 [Methylococcaceae bacterium]|nr:hypothetical protein [Methylococcaceae bacterium]
MNKLKVSLVTMAAFSSVICVDAYALLGNKFKNKNNRFSQITKIMIS